MRTLMVGYDLNRPGQRYAGLIEALQSVPGWWHYLDSTWLLRTTETAAQLRDRLSSFLDASDELLVIDVTGSNAAWAGFGPEAARWIHEHL